MTDQDLKAIAASGMSEVARKSPLAWALVVLVLAIAWMSWTILSESRTERAEQAAYMQSLTAQLVECHREK